MTIKVLPAHVSDQIAAGEVVERPASVVKELVENSIDAGAKHIEIKVVDGGRTLIEIKDDGKGMPPKDAKNCVLRHATSKIQNIDDLFSIQSFGFRGEALAAISAVSKFELITKTAQEEAGTKISLEGGQKKKIETVPANQGTIIRIRDLFYSTPVRLEYLKTDETEYRQILKEITYFALSYPEVSFKLFKNEKLSQDIPVAQNLKFRIQQILPKFSNNFISVQKANNDTTVSGFVCEAGTCQSTKNHQYVFVNGRHISDFKINYAAREAYIQSCGIEHHLHPVFVLFIETDPILVDVNVHPRKLEIKFSEPADIFQLVKYSVIEALSKTPNKSPIASFLSTHSFSTPKPSKSKISAGNSFSQKLFSSPQKSFSDRHTERSIINTKISSSETNETIENIEKLTAIGQIGKKYIIAESENGVYLFDQHALHERERFEKFWNEYKAKEMPIQKLLTSQILEFTEEEISLLHENKSLLLNMGLTISFPEDTKIEIKAIPTVFANQDLEKIMLETLQYIENNRIGEHAQDQIMRKLLEYKSCRGAIMYGDKISMTEAQKLLDDFIKTKWANLCPHGRPNHVLWTFEELDKKFHR